METKQQNKARTLTINKGNWSGEDVTVRVKKDGSFKLFGETFKMSEKEDETGEKGEMLYTITDSNNNHVIYGFKTVSERLPRLNGVTFCHGSIERNHKSNPYIAAIQVLCMIY